MAVTNSIRPAAAKQETHVTTFMANGIEVKLTPEIVRNYLVSGGGKDKVTLQEVGMFINLCRYQGLNPWLKEAYCIKYGSEPATVVVGKEAFLKRAESDPRFDGFEAGVVVEKEDGTIEYRTGTLIVDKEKIIGGWAEVYRKDRSHSYREEVSMREYSTGKSNWNTKPATMIRKVAIVQALREAFPACLGGMYTAEEQGQEENEQQTAMDAIDAETGEVNHAAEAPKPAPAEKESLF